MAAFEEFQVEGTTEPIMVCFFSTLKYCLSNGMKLDIEQESAWCEGCRSFVSAEYVPSDGELNKRIGELQAPTKKHWFIHRTQQAINNAIDELQTRLKWRASRQSPARCLMCGSTEITSIRFENEKTCLVHGRRIKELGRGFASMQDWIAEYTPEGVAIGEQSG